ncbi:MAG: trypsin-like peptidase domain-containing protein, partial [Planctomycetes bacterium]|nr:trypsin-like peptidase domain-containing protein [Planctomycetota bacterium]
MKLSKFVPIIGIFIFGLLVFLQPIPGVARAGTPGEENVRLVAEVKPAIVGVKALCDGRPFHGTGIIITPEGHILTSTTVILPTAKDVKIRLSDARTLPAEIVMSDEETEAVLLKIAGEGHPYLELGDSDKVLVGQAVYTFGDALTSITEDDQIAVGAGVISGIYVLEKTSSYKIESSGGKYQGKMIETTAAINGGIDGGPLVNAKKEVIGLVSLNYSRDRWLGLAIPISAIKEKLKKKIKLPAGTTTASYPEVMFPSFAHLAKKVTPAIVGIKIEFKKKPEPEKPPEKVPGPGQKLDKPPPEIKG